MVGDRTHVGYVTGSSVRSAVVRAVGDGTRSMEGLLESVAASESAVYGAVSELQERGVLTETDELRLTGIGGIVRDALSQLDATESLLSGDAEYWRSHRIDVLPRQFRTDLAALAGCDVVRATDTDPHRAVRTVANRLEAAEQVAIASPIYQDEYAMKLPETGEVRLLLDAAVLANSTVIEGGIEPPENVQVRVGEVDFALTVTDDAIMLSLPKIDGEYDTKSELIAESDCALDWGRRLYDHCWERARPVSETRA